MLWGKCVVQWCITSTIITCWGTETWLEVWNEFRGLYIQAVVHAVWLVQSRLLIPALIEGCILLLVVKGSHRWILSLVLEWWLTKIVVSLIKISALIHSHSWCWSSSRAKILVEIVRLHHERFNCLIILLWQ